jgi:hypothetical protein
MSIRILSVRKAYGLRNAVCFANVALTDDIAAFDVKVVDNGGKLAAYAPNSHGARVVTFSPKLGEAIAKSAIEHLKGPTANASAA